MSLKRPVTESETVTMRHADSGVDLEQLRKRRENRTESDGCKEIIKSEEHAGRRSSGGSSGIETNDEDRSPLLSSQEDESDSDGRGTPLDTATSQRVSCTDHRYSVATASDDIDGPIFKSRKHRHRKAPQPQSRGVDHTDSIRQGTVGQRIQHFMSLSASDDIDGSHPQSLGHNHTDSIQQGTVGLHIQHFMSLSASDDIDGSHPQSLGHDHTDSIQQGTVGLHIQHFMNLISCVPQWLCVRYGANGSKRVCLVVERMSLSVRVFTGSAAWNNPDRQFCIEYTSNSAKDPLVTIKSASNKYVAVDFSKNPLLSACDGRKSGSNISTNIFSSSDNDKTAYYFEHNSSYFFIDVDIVDVDSADVRLKLIKEVKSDNEERNQYTKTKHRRWEKLTP